MDLGAGTGALKRGARRRHMRELARTATGEARRAREDRLTRSGGASTRSDARVAGSPEDFAVLGIAVEVVKLSPEQARAAGWPSAGVENGGT